MKLKIIKNKNNKWDFLLSNQTTPTYEDKATFYNMKQLLIWEEHFKEILSIINGQDKQEGIRLLFELAEEGYPEARRLLSDMYIEGKDLPEDFSKAVEWDRRANYAEALFRPNMNLYSE